MDGVKETSKRIEVGRGCDLFVDGVFGCCEPGCWIAAET
jgi:hypothetical protein